MMDIFFFWGKDGAKCMDSGQVIVKQLLAVEN